MELADFVTLIKRHKLTLIIIPLITIIATYYAVRNLPDSYVSETMIATGIVDQSQKLPDAASDQESQVSVKFSNLITMTKMPKVLNQVSYQLILHDLTNDVPFRKPSKLLHDLNSSAREHAIEVYTKMYNTHSTLQVWDKDQSGLNSLIGSMHYDPASILAKMSVSRSESSDYIHLEFESENPQLSAFVVNTFVREFIDYQTATERQGQNKSVNFLDSLLKDKKQAMDKDNDSLKNYKIKNHILNLTEQASSLYAQISDYEGRAQTAEQDVAAKTGALKNLNSKFNPSERAAMGKLNTRIVANEDLQKLLTDRYIKSGYNPYYKLKLDSVKNILTDQINESVDDATDNPTAAKNALRSQKLSLEVDLDLAKYSINTIQNEIVRLKKQQDILVPHEAVLQALQNKIDEDSKEFLDLQGKYNQASVQADFSVKLRQVDLAMPGAAASSKKMVITIAAGIIMELICILVLFILFYLDDTIKHPKALVNKTKLPVLGYLNTIKGSSLDLKKLWDIENRNKMQQFKDLLRSIRFEIDQELGDNKILAITSLSEGEGKTLLAISLAYSYSIINKKVLLIDGNFSNPTISSTVQPKLFIEDYFRSGFDGASDLMNSNISVLGNQGNDITLLEIDNEKTIQQKFLRLRSMYDIIIIEVQDLDKMNKAKEWMLFADKTISVFEANRSFNESKNASVKYLRALGPRFAGWIFNKAPNEGTTYS